VSGEAYGYYYNCRFSAHTYTHTHQNIYLPETVSLKIVYLSTVTVKDIP